MSRYGTSESGVQATIHGSTHVDVETDSDGKVVAVWFRCLRLAFKQADASEPRAAEMTAGEGVHIIAVDTKEPL